MLHYVGRAHTTPQAVQPHNTHGAVPPTKNMGCQICHLQCGPLDHVGARSSLHNRYHVGARSSLHNRYHVWVVSPSCGDLMPGCGQALRVPASTYGRGMHCKETCAAAQCVARRRVLPTRATCRRRGQAATCPPPRPWSNPVIGKAPPQLPTIHPHRASHQCNSHFTHAARPSAPPTTHPPAQNMRATRSPWHDTHAPKSVPAAAGPLLTLPAHCTACQQHSTAWGGCRVPQAGLRLRNCQQHSTAWVPCAPGRPMAMHCLSSPITLLYFSAVWYCLLQPDSCDVLPATAVFMRCAVHALL